MISATLAGVAVVQAGYAAAFLVLASFALLGALAFCMLMPESRSADVEGATVGTPLPA